MTKSAVVTGGAGFIGSHLVDLLLVEGVDVVVVDDLSTGYARSVPAGAKLETVDITDHAAFDRVVDIVHPWAIFHLAAQSSVTVSVSEPRRDCAVNVLGTLNVLEASKRHSAPVIFASTGGALYGNDAPLPTSEDRLPAPVAPYGASKWAGEAYVVTWAEAAGLPHAICRLGNVYGPRQSPYGEAGAIAIFSHKLWRRERPTLFGYGEPTRDYVHVSDVARGMRAAAGVRGVFNISTGSESSVLDLYERLQEIAGMRIEPKLAPLRAGELKRSCMNPDRAHEQLAWQASVSIEEGLRTTYEALIKEFEAEESGES